MNTVACIFWHCLLSTFQATCLVMLKKLCKIQVCKNKIADKPDKKIRCDTIKFGGISSEELDLVCTWSHLTDHGDWAMIRKPEAVNSVYSLLNHAV